MRLALFIHKVIKIDEKYKEKGNIQILGIFSTNKNA